jgi:hypothetical protein
MPFTYYAKSIQPPKERQNHSELDTGSIGAEIQTSRGKLVLKLIDPKGN